MSRLSDAQLQARISSFEAINRDRALTDLEADQLWRLVHIQTCRIKARRATIARNEARLALLTGAIAAGTIFKPRSSAPSSSPR